MGALLAIVVGILLYGTLYPFQFHFHRLGQSPFQVLLHSWPTVVDRFFWRDAVVNVAIFVPLGITAFLVFSRRVGGALGLVAAVVMGSALSASIEMLQIFDAHRTCSAMDWLCNTLGTFTGAVLALAFQPQIEKVLSPAGRRGASAGLLLAGCWMGSQLYPLIPLFSRGHLRAAWHYLMASPISWVEVFAGAAGWFVFGIALRAVWGRVTVSLLALTTLAVPFRLLIADRTVSQSELLAAALGLLLWVAVAERVRLSGAWMLLLAAIVLRELAPFDFGGFHSFSWIPFSATMAAERSASVAVILRKAFEYGSMVWLLRAQNLSYRTGALVVAALLAALEVMQCFLPGRSAEITDAVLALIMGLVLHLIG